MPMRIFRVGGSVRDELLGRQPIDHDLVVVGATIPEFLAVYPEAVQIGKAFPVFQVMLEGQRFEFAFARRERKTGPGHAGFEVIADQSVTLEQDLSRRDLTINAMAKEIRNFRNVSELTGSAWPPPLIDPFGGLADLEARVLRHVSPAFAEDPLRVFRVARSAARWGFMVHLDTLRIMASIPKTEIAALSAERVGAELLKALSYPDADLFFLALRACGQLNPWFAHVYALIGVPAGQPHHHGEGDTFNHTMLALRHINRGSVAEKLAVLCHDFGKALTPRSDWPKHHGHDQTGLPAVAGFCDGLRLPTALKKAALLGCEQHLRVHKFREMRPGKQVDLIAMADATVLRTEGLARVCAADSLGRIPPAAIDGIHALLIAAPAARAERGQPIPESLEGPERGLHVRMKKGLAVRHALAGPWQNGWQGVIIR